MGMLGFGVKGYRLCCSFRLWVFGTGSFLPQPTYESRYEPRNLNRLPKILKNHSAAIHNREGFILPA